MLTIKSDLDGASVKATALKAATDTQTTVLGNASALKAITSAQQTAQEIASAV